jgi:hypothetical protein
MRVLFLVLLAMAAASPAYAQSGGAYSLDWNTLTTGGATFATGGSYRMGGSIGQPDGGSLAAGAYRLQGGFWTPVVTRTVGVPTPDDGTVPKRFTSLAPAPNPSRDGVRFAFDLPTTGAVRLTLYDVHGRLVRTLLDGARAPGRHIALWDGATGDGRRVPAGMYFARLVVGENTATHRFIRLD